MQAALNAQFSTGIIPSQASIGRTALQIIMHLADSHRILILPANQYPRVVYATQWSPLFAL
jgi:hypothetical protein